MKIKPIGARVLVKYEKPAEKAKSGILLSGSSLNPNYFTGVVDKVGDTKVVAKGDRIAFLKYGYEDMGDELYLVEENSIVAVLEE